MSVLIVDDVEEVRKIIREELSALIAGIKILEAHSGNSALTILKQNKSIRLVITDWEMPDGKGDTILNFLIKQNSNILLYIYTSIRLRFPSDVKYTFKIYEKPDLENLLKDCVQSLK